MGAFKLWTMSLAVLFIQGCSSADVPAPTPPVKTVFDPVTQPLDKARGVQKTVDQNAESTQKAVDSQERGDPSQ
jgi:hypothetical protein